MRFKVRIFQPIVPEYRKALFEGLGKRYGERIDIFAAQGIGQDESYPLEYMRYDYTHPFRRIGPICWQCGLPLDGLSRGDVIVVCGDVHQLSSLWIAFRAKRSGIKVVWWGHHRTATSTDCAVAIRLWISKRLSDVFLAYTRTGVRYLVSKGFQPERVFATGNTIDQGPIKAAIATTKVGPTERPLLLCCGVMREKIHLELVVRALTDGRLKNVDLAVIGEGPMKSVWQKLSLELGVADRISWIPGTRDQKVMAPWFLKAKAFVYPGSIGLSILHSFSYGLPVITHGNSDHQMPEFEVMEEGKTGFCFKEGDNGDLTEKIIELLSDEKRRMEMSMYCQKLAFEKYSMEQMVANFAEAIEGAANA